MRESSGTPPGTWALMACQERAGAGSEPAAAVSACGRLPAGVRGEPPPGGSWFVGSHSW